MLYRKFASLLLVAALLPCLRLPAAADADAGAQALLAKHKAFAGWQLGDGTFNTLRLEREYTAPGGRVTERSLQRRVALLYRETITNVTQRTTEERGFTGNVFWATNWNGFTTPVFGDLAKYRITYDGFLNEGLTALPGVLRGQATVDGTPVTIVRVAVPNGDAADLYIDPATGAFAKVVIDPGGDYETAFRILSYVDGLPGKKLLGSYRVDNDPGVYSFTKIEPNLPIPNTELHPPAAVATWSFANPNPFPIKTTDDRFYVDATIDGVPGRFILDTGASEIYLTDAFAKRSHFKTLWSNDDGSGIGSSVVKSDGVKIDTLTIGGNTLSNVYAQINRSGFEGDKEAPDGLIGFDLFAGAVVTINTAASTMTLADPSTPVDTSSGLNVIVDLSSQQPRVPMTLNGSIAVNALLDSGDPAYVLLAKDLISRYGMRMLVDNSDVGYLQSHLAMGGVAGVEADECGHIESLALGPIVYQGTNACTSPSFDGREILVGFDFLKHFDMIFDYPHGRIIMTPHKEQ